MNFDRNGEPVSINQLDATYMFNAKTKKKVFR